jgi:hypothetical protein
VPSRSVMKGTIYTSLPSRSVFQGDLAIGNERHEDFVFRFVPSGQGDPSGLDLLRAELDGDALPSGKAEELSGVHDKRVLDVHYDLRNKRYADFKVVADQHLDPNFGDWPIEGPFATGWCLRHMVEHGAALSLTTADSCRRASCR